MVCKVNIRHMLGRNGLAASENDLENSPAIFFNCSTINVCYAGFNKQYHNLPTIEHLYRFVHIGNSGSL